MERRNISIGEKKMKSKLNLDFDVVASARNHAANIAKDMQEFISRHTTVSTERTILRLLGVDGVDDVDTPLPNVVVDQLKDAGVLSTGVAYWIGNAIVQTGKDPQTIAEEMSEGKLDVTNFLPVQLRRLLKHSSHQSKRHSRESICRRQSVRNISTELDQAQSLIYMLS